MAEELVTPQDGDPEKEALRKQLMDAYSKSTASAAQGKDKSKEALRKRLIEEYSKPAAPEAPVSEPPPFLKAPQQPAAGGASSITPPTAPPAPTPSPEMAGGTASQFDQYSGPDTQMPGIRPFSPTGALRIPQMMPTERGGAGAVAKTDFTILPEAERQAAQATVDRENKRAMEVMNLYRSDRSPIATRAKVEAMKVLEGDEAARAYMAEEMARIKTVELPKRAEVLKGMEQGFLEDKRQFEAAVAELQAKVPQYEAAAAQDPAAGPAIQAQYDQELQAVRSMEDMLRKQASIADAYAKSVEQDRVVAAGYEYLTRSRQGTFKGATWNNMLDAVGSSVSGLNAPILSAMLKADPAKPRDGETQDQANARVKRAILGSLRQAPKKAVGTEGTTEEYVQKMQDTFLGGAWLAGTGSLTNMVAGGGVGLMTAAADNVRAEMEDESFADVADWKKELFSNTVGVVIGQLEKYGIQQAIGGGTIARQVMARALGKLPQNATTAQIKAAIMAESESAAANFAARLGGSALAEGATEFQQGLIEPAMKDLFNLAEEKNLLTRADGSEGFNTPEGLSGYVSDALYQAAQGMVIGGVMGTPGAVYKHMQDGTVGKTTNDAQFELTESLLKDREFETTLQEDLAAQVESAKISQARAEEIRAAWKEAQTVVAKIPDDLPTDKKREAFDLLTEKQRLSKLDKSMVGDRIMKVDEKLAKVAGVPDAKAETKEWSGKEVEPKAKPSPEPAPAETPVPVAEAEVVTEDPVVKTTQEIQPEDGGQAEVGVGESPLGMEGDALGASAGTGASGDMAGQTPAIGQVDTPVDGGGADAAVDVGPAEGLGASHEAVPEEPATGRALVVEAGAAEQPAATPETERPAEVVKTPKPKAPKKAAAKQATPKVEEPPAPKVVEAAKPTAIPASFKREGQEAVTEPVIVVERKDAIGPDGTRGRQREYIYPGLEEYRLATSKVKGGYKVYEITSGAAISKQAQPNEILALADAAEIINRNGKEKVDALISAQVEQKRKLSDKISGLKIDTERLGGVAFSLPLPVSPKLIAQAINTALDTVAAAVRAAENLSSALGRARKEYQGQDWYKKLDTAGKQRANAVFRDRVARPISALATDEEKPKKSKVQRQANKATGVTKDKSIIAVDERVALKERLRGLAKAATGAVRQYRSASKDFAGAVKTALRPLRAKLGGAKVAAITNAALKVNPTDQLKVERFLQYVDNVITKANYADDLAKARKAQKKAIKAMKSRILERNHKEALRALADVDVDSIDDLVEYTAYVSNYAEASKSPASEKYKQLDSREAIKFAQSLYAQEEKAYVNALLSEFGVEANSAEAKAIYEAILSDKTSDEAMQNLATRAKEKAIMLADRMRIMAVSRASILKSEIKDGLVDTSTMSDTQKKLVDYLAMAEPANMTAEAHAAYIRAVDNLLVSGSLHGAMRAAVQAKASATTLQAAKLVEGYPVMRLFSKGLSREVMSFSDIFTFFFGGRSGPWDKVQQVMGIGNFYASKKKWADQVIETERKMTNFYNELNNQYKQSNDAPHKIAEFIAATLIQRMPGLSERESIAINKDLILQDIEKKDGLDGYKKHVTLATSVYESVFKDAKTVEDVFSSLKKSYPAAEKSVKFMIDLSKQYKELFEQVSELVYNDPGDYTDPNYITRSIMPAPGDADVSDIGGPRVMRKDTIKPTRAKGTIQRQVYWSLPAGAMFNWDLRQSALKNLSSNLYDSLVAPAQMEVGAFMESAEARKVFGSKDNVSFVKGQMSSYFKSEFKKLEGLEGVFDKFTNSARNMLVPMALGGITQPIKQYPEAIAQAAIMNGLLSPQRLARAVAANMTGNANDLLNQFAIGSRAGIQGGTNWSGRISTELEAFNAAIANNIVDKASKHYAKAQQIFMWALSKSDAAAAKTAWLALYEKRRNEQGHKVLSWSQEAEMLQRDEQRMQAALYAEGSIDTFMVSSDPAKVAKIAKRDAGFGNFVKAMFFALTGYSFQSLSRKAIDASILWSYTKKLFSGDPSRKYLDTAGALRSQLASITGAAVYGASAMLVFAMKDYLAEQFISAFDDEDEEAALKYIAALHALYMLRIPIVGDTDVFGTSQIAANNLLKARKANMTYADYMAANRDDAMSDKIKQTYTRLMLEAVGLGVSQEGYNFIVDSINKQYYKELVEAGDPSVMTKRGKPMDYDFWVKDPSNTLVARPGQGWNDAWEFGVFGMMMSNAERIDKMLPEYIDAFSDEEGGKSLPAPPPPSRSRASSRRSSGDIPQPRRQ